MVPLTQLIQALPAAIPFVGPETIERRLERPFQARMGANESAFGMSPIAANAIAAACSDGAWYGDPECYALRAQLAVEHGVAMDEICVAAGIDELLGLAVRLVCQPGTAIVTSDGAYPTLNYHIAGFGGERVAVAYRDDHEDLEGLADAVRTHRAALVYLANPDNPMGSWHSAAAVRQFIASLPDDVLIILDEAYVEFAPQDAIPPLDMSDPRVMRMRTFSKAHGLAGLRIGYVLGHRQLIQALGKIRNHFGVNRLAQAAALASLGDKAFIEGVCEAVREGRDAYGLLAQDWGFQALPSATNFVAIDVGSPELSRAILQGLEARGVFIRMPGVAPLNRCIRISVGNADERDLLATAMAEILPQLGVER